MNQRRKKAFARLLSRSGPIPTGEESSPTTSARTEINSSLSLSSLDASGDQKGSLGLITLHEPPAHISITTDLIFIHGLGGGSRKTWSYSPDPAHFWPHAWLPHDDDFADVRIHTFGYKADWGERRQSILSIHDFAQSLLGALRNHSGIRRSTTRVILVGHSMGGCVAKMMYNLARQDPTASGFAARVHSIFFLGTPHRGSEMAAVLENILTVAWGKKPFVTDLIPNSAALNAINDTFRHLSPALRLWSFYETLPVRAAGLLNRRVVERHSATLGYHNEEIAAMNADHRHVCKFDSASDPNYQLLRNALLTAVDTIREVLASDVGSVNCGEGTDTVTPSIASPHTATSVSSAKTSSRLRTYLDVRNSVDGDLVNLQLFRQPGSCQWFTTKDCFMTWKAGTGPGILWLAGKPATGKSVIAGHVIDQLVPDVLCSYFICKHGKSGQSTLSDCLKSLAFQMAMQDTMVRDALLNLELDGSAWDKADDTSIWRRLFTSTIFKLPSMCRHYWVIDGIDECSNFNSLFTKRYLSGLPDGLRLFATSRRLDEIERGLVSLGPSRASLHSLSDTDTLEDIRLFLTTRLNELGRPSREEDRRLMCEKILKKSSGSFLWAHLVLQEFRNSWTEEAMNAVLQEVPADLHELYSRMVQSIEIDKHKLELAKSILTCVVLACRPLTVDELRCAVKLDVDQTLQNVAGAVPELCGQLVSIDQDNKVHMIHETAREFLVAEDSGRQPVVAKGEGHTRLGSLLLQYLSSKNGNPYQKHPESGGWAKSFAKPTLSTTVADTSLLDYASSFFSAHVYRASSEDENLMEDLCQFLVNDSVLSWIEHVAKGGDLTDITRTAINMREYLVRRTKYYPQTHPSNQLIDNWVTDLIRVAAKFRAQLLACPSSVHCLIPPLCPSESIIRRTFNKEEVGRLSPISVGLTVKGLQPGSWDDCLIRLDFPKGQATAVSHGDRFFAVGLSTGQISLYDSSSLQLLRKMVHPERVKAMQFTYDDLHLASCGSKTLAVWDSANGTLKHSFSLRSTPLSIKFLGTDEIICAYQSTELSRWSLDTAEHHLVSWRYSDFDGDGGQLSPLHDIIPSQPPSRVTFLTTTSEVLMAVGYRTHPILLWDALELQLLGTCSTNTDNNGLDAMVFNPNPDIPVLVVSYQDGKLCVFDYVTLELHFTRPGVFAHSIMCSPDGRSLVTGNGQGFIEVFDFERTRDGSTSLSLIYRTDHPPDDAIRGVTFSGDSLRLLDVRGQQGRLWAPAALVRKNTSDVGGSVAESARGDPASLFKPRPSTTFDNLGHSEICSPLLAIEEGVVIAGKTNGDVVLFSTADARQLCMLYQHARGASIVALAYEKSGNLIVSADDSGRVKAVEVLEPLSIAATATTTKRLKTRTVLDHRFGGAVACLLLSPTADRVLISGRYVDRLLDVSSGKVVAEFTLEAVSDVVASAARGPESGPLAPAGAAEPRLPRQEDSFARHPATTRIFFHHPSVADWFVAVTADVARVYLWSDFSELTPHGGLFLDRQPAQATYSFLQDGKPIPGEKTPSHRGGQRTATATYHVGPGYVIELFRESTSSLPCIYLWLASTLSPSASGTLIRPEFEPNLEAIGPAVADVIGMAGPSTLVFLDADLWICSTELQSLITRPSHTMSRTTVNTTRTSISSMSTASASTTGSRWPESLQTVSIPQGIHVRRHFFALSEWRTANFDAKLRCTLTAAPVTMGRGKGGIQGRDLVVATGNGIVVVKGGLAFSESVVSSADPLGHNGLVPPPVKAFRGPGEALWTVVSGSMHRRGSNR